MMLWCARSESALGADTRRWFGARSRAKESMLASSQSMRGPCCCEREARAAEADSTGPCVERLTRSDQRQALVIHRNGHGLQRRFIGESEID